uniref:Alkaline ceramidase n=1 Tax=Ditylenchus dipsaci TaxID=166011 RepID=A0A915DLG4_9BILA
MHPWLEYESGQSWCESSYSKYQTIPFVAEFANTVTNLPIIVLPLLNAFMLRRYIVEVNSVIILPHLLLTLNGWHPPITMLPSTSWSIGGWLSILWLINICLVAYLPTMKWYPSRYRQHINGMRWAIVLLTTLISALCFLKPSLNAFALMTISLPAVVVIYYEAFESVFQRLKSYLWGLSCGSSYCILMSSAAAYNLFIMFSILDIQRRSHEHNFLADIRYFPFQSGKYLSFAYIALRQRDGGKDVQE